MNKMIPPKKIVCIFAHPDDEAMGPGGTIVHFLKEGCKVYLICVTSGNANGSSELGEIRKKELQKSTKILGINNNNLYLLGFDDGTLNNNNYHLVVEKIEKILLDIKPDTLLTYNMNGVSGHLDHIAVSMQTSYLFERLKFVRQILYFTHLKSIKKLMGNKYFVYFPEGLDKENMDLTVDVSSYLDIKIKAIKAHVSQTKNKEIMFLFFKRLLKEEYFKVIQK
ncbi:MAG: PIG-L deacetylase family protein [Candidatus Woesebacteria bacterium]|nr:PIG-L deacetylase family protein [Candidatus Woesebacteria bacterium]